MAELGRIMAVYKAYPEGTQQNNWGLSTIVQVWLPKYQGTTQDLGRKGQLTLEVRHKVWVSAAVGGLVPQP